MPRNNDPLRNFRFRLEIDGITQAAFSDVMIAETTIDAIDYREGTDQQPNVRKLSGLTKYGNITLKWGLTVSDTALKLFEWFASVSAGRGNRAQKVTINVLNEAGDEAARFLVEEAWPVKYDLSDLNAKGNEVFIELLELAHEGLTREA